MMFWTLVVASLAPWLCVCDLYMHMPRGSNNRLNEQAANRNNANRLFDSQNNNRGGYNVGDLDPTNGFNADDWMASANEMYNFRFLYQSNTLRKQYEMLYFENTWMSTTWTNQHGTGNKKLNSMMVLQYICDTFPRADDAGSDGDILPTEAISPEWTATHITADKASELRKHFLRVELYNGGTTNTPNQPNEINADPATTASNLQSTYQGNNNDNSEGRRESEDFYAACRTRKRQDGLFHADQRLRSDAQIYTRQNPGGTRRGLECPEERDYYPWWNPSPFHDIAIITHDVDYCNNVIRRESQNVKAKYQCVRSGVTGASTGAQTYPTREAAELNLDEEGCDALADHEWAGFKWGGGSSDFPECVDSYWSKVNHLGNVDGTKRGGKMAHYDWLLPSVETLSEDHFCYPYTYTVADTTGTDGSDEDHTTSMKCVRMMFRMRYNMSTMDYDPYKTDSSQDEDDYAGVVSPIENNPTVDVGIYAQGLRLAINTAQTGRVFQDNSHTFLVCERPSAATGWNGRKVYNVNVRGKRGNIVQTFPAIEYDFEPQHIEIERGECLHFQWTGSNTHNNGNPAGDGQAGDAGEGRGGSDRSNLVETKSMDESYPLTYDQFDPDFFDEVTCYHPLFTQSQSDVTPEDARLILGTGGFYRSVADARKFIETTIGANAVIDVLMNNVSASFKQGLICCVTGDQGAHSFISTRNNNFTNRSQKLRIIITNTPDDTANW